MRKQPSYGLAGFIMVIILLLGALGISIARANYHDHIATCTIVDKDRGYDPQSRSSNYRIYTKQCGTLKNTDQWFVGKTDSADIQGQLQIGHTYRIEIVGWRFSLLSEFPNVVKVDGEVTS